MPQGAFALNCRTCEVDGLCSGSPFAEVGGFYLGAEARRFELKPDACLHCVSFELPGCTILSS